jgi:hypothetical protein
MIMLVVVAATLGVVTKVAQRPACAFSAPPAIATGAADDDVVKLKDVPPLGGGPMPLLPEDANALGAAVRAYGAEHPDVYGDVFLGQGHLWVGFTADAAHHLAALRVQVDHPELLRAFEADFPERDLLALQDRITRDLTTLAAQGINASVVMIDVVHNRVEVDVAGEGNHARDVLTRRYGGAMLIVRGGVELHTVPLEAHTAFPDPARPTKPRDAPHPRC